MRNDEIVREERAIYIIILVALAPVVVSLVYHGAHTIDGGTTLSLLIVACGIVGLAACVRKMRSRFPIARIHNARRRS